MTRKKKRKATRESGQMGSVDEFSAMMVNMVAKRCADCGEETDLFKQGNGWTFGCPQCDRE